GGADHEDFTADDVILDALRAFSCHGGVAFAAAGNHGGQDSWGLMSPADYQDEKEPSDMECAGLLNGSQDFFKALRDRYSARTSGKSYPRPYVPPAGKPPAQLLHAVGGFDRGYWPIMKTRERACPRYGALGLGWSVPGETDLVLTGTSVSTAVVSGFFAAAM